MRVFLTCYSFQIHPKGRPKEFIRFNDLPGTNKIFRAALTDYLTHTQGNTIIDQAEAACYKIDQLHIAGDIIHGTFVSGDYGHSSNFINIQTEQNSFRRSPDDAEQIPYHFFFSFADGDNKGILITQKLGNRGIQTSFRNIIQAYLSQHYQLIIKFSDLIPTEVYDYLRKGDTTKVTINNVKLPKEQIKLLGWEDVSVEEIADVQFVIKAKKGAVLPLLDAIQNRYTSIIEKRLDEDSGTASGVDIEVNYGGNQRTVRLDKPNSFSPVVDISTEVTMTNGIPDYNDILRQSEFLLRDARAQLGLDMPTRQE